MCVCGVTLCERMYVKHGFRRPVVQGRASARVCVDRFAWGTGGAGAASLRREGGRPFGVCVCVSQSVCVCVCALSVFACASAFDGSGVV